MAECAGHPPPPKEEKAIDHDDGPLEVEQEKHDNIETGQTKRHRTNDQIDTTTNDQQADTGGKDAPNTASTQDQLIFQGARKPENILPQTPTEPRTVRNVYMFLAFYMLS